MTNPIQDSNPFTIVYDALWALARSNPELRKWVPEKNQIDYQKWIGPKKNITDSDYPELSLTSESTFSNIRNTSTSTMVIKEYSWMVITGDYRIDDIFNQISWELFRSMIDWCNVLGSLTWKDKVFVVRANFLTSSEGTLFQDLNKHINGWVITWPFEVEMHFQTSDLIPIKSDFGPHFTYTNPVVGT
jgi:hypothetical protein